MKILLISGHGAGDVGACGCGFQEYALTRELVNNIAPKLRKYATVDVYDQNRNAFYDCQRGTFNIGAYDYVLEVHFNAFNGQAHGTEIFVTDREKAVTVEKEIMKNMGKFFTLRGNAGVKVTNFLVINTVKSKGISSALIETCFIDNQDDMNVYVANKDKVAQAIVDGIVVGFGLGEVSKPTVTPAPKPEPVPNATGIIKVGSVVRPKINVSYDGVQLASFVCSNNYPVIELKGNRAVLGNELNTAFNTANLTLISGGGSTPQPAPTNTIKVGSSVIVTNPVDVNGTRLGVSGTYTVMEINGSRVVIGRGGVVTAAININNLKLA